MRCFDVFLSPWSGLCGRQKLRCMAKRISKSSGILMRSSCAIVPQWTKAVGPHRPVASIALAFGHSARPRLRLMSYLLVTRPAWKASGLFEYHDTNPGLWHRRSDRLYMDAIVAEESHILNLPAAYVYILSLET